MQTAMAFSHRLPRSPYLGQRPFLKTHPTQHQRLNSAACRFRWIITIIIVVVARSVITSPCFDEIIAVQLFHTGIVPLLLCEFCLALQRCRQHVVAELLALHGLCRSYTRPSTARCAVCEALHLLQSLCCLCQRSDPT